MVTGIPGFPLWVGKVSLQNRQILEQLSADWGMWGSLELAGFLLIICICSLDYAI